jgi:hypothetical protein
MSGRNGTAACLFFYALLLIACVSVLYWSYIGGPLHPR